MDNGNFLILSDTHFGHEKILEFERGSRFSAIQDHDRYMAELVKKGFRKLGANDTFYFLGDWGLMEGELWEDLLSAAQTAPCRKIAVRGNHDKDVALNQLASLGFVISEYPIFIDKRVVLSHHPILFAETEGRLDICGHCHDSYVDDPHCLCASVAVANYNFVTKQMVQTRLAQLPKWNMRFLWEPWADKYRFCGMAERDDIICDKDGRIDLSASRILQHQKDIERKED